MNIQIETITTTSGKMDVIRDVEKMKAVLAIAEKAFQSIRQFQCGHKPSLVVGKCDACEALKGWDEMMKR